ncbi:MULTISPECIES: hypothetical protein [unclassified Brevibacillus]|uniref:hypothetical protein n=1 Tax=unclassified Brevibacillus TaxID=2684853 RepID=UPI00356207B4
MMFKTTHEFDAALVKVLKNIQEGVFYHNESYDFDERTFTQLIKHALQQGLVDGYAEIRFAGQDPGYKAMDPQVSYAGMKFIEKN